MIHLRCHKSSLRTKEQPGLLTLVSMRAILLAVSYASVLFLTGCGELEPMIEPEVVDLQLTIDTLKTQVRDTQRTMAELRTELESRRQELADAQVAKAQLEGRVREAERRVAEARHVINLQREELAAARTERERISRSSAQLQSQMRKFQKHVPSPGTPGEGDHEVAPASAGPASRKAQKASAAPLAVETSPLASPLPDKVAATPAALVEPPPAMSASSSNGARSSSFRTVSVKPGDTLWSIAHKYHVDLDQLRTLNHLPDNRIAVGQAIWVPAGQTGRDQIAEVVP
jgi:hypothetical protein